MINSFNRSRGRSSLGQLSAPDHNLKEDEIMTIDEMKQWIDGASYEQLLHRWRFSPTGSPWFQGEIGAYYKKVMFSKKEEVGNAEHSATSKRIGW